MATIKPIEGRSVHQIQSGQVIVDLQSVCRELVENSIDAGATSIEVRFRNYGLDVVEVQDNGSGIAPADYSTIALSHYTSKLASYDDLSSLQTYGFRGEALSSLCALSSFHVVTAQHNDVPKGTKLEFEQSGKLKGTSSVAAKQGMIVSVEMLFHNLPVRRKELEKNTKREYNKVLQLLNAYACISVGLKFTVSNVVPKGKKTIAFSTNTNLSTKDNILNVYGAKTITALIPLNLKFKLSPSSDPRGTQRALKRVTPEDNGSHTVKIVGHISRPVVGRDRQTPDRQMFFVNSRPCDLPQFAQAINKLYKSFNVTQPPFIFADVQLDTNAYNVNVSPDKRTILLHDQHALLERLKEALLELFEGHDRIIPQSQSSVNKTAFQNIFDRMRPMQIPAQQATRSRSSNLVRVHKPRFSSGKPLDQTLKPKVKKSLREFVAPGTRKGNQYTRVPFLHKPISSKAFEMSHKDEIAASSSAYRSNPAVEDILAINSLSVAKTEIGARAGDSDEDEKKAMGEEKMIAKANKAAAWPIEAKLERARKLFKVSQRKHHTINLRHVVETNVDSIVEHMQKIKSLLIAANTVGNDSKLPISTQPNQDDSEERLSHTVAKLGFNEMRIIGQFNPNFIITVRTLTTAPPTSDLFIMDNPRSSPHGRPTMIHLYGGLEKFGGWCEGDRVIGDDKSSKRVDWVKFMRNRSSIKQHVQLQGDDGKTFGT